MAATLSGGGEEPGEGFGAVGEVAGAVAFGLEVEEEAGGEVFFVFDEEDEGAHGSVVDGHSQTCLAHRVYWAASGPSVPAARRADSRRIALSTAALPAHCPAGTR